MKNILMLAASVVMAIGSVGCVVYAVSKPAIEVSTESAALSEVRKTNPSAQLGSGRLVDLGGGRYTYMVEIR